MREMITSNAASTTLIATTKMSRSRRICSNADNASTGLSKRRERRERAALIYMKTDWVCGVASGCAILRATQAFQLPRTHFLQWRQRPLRLSAVREQGRSISSARLAPRKRADVAVHDSVARSRGGAHGETRKIAAILVADVVGYSRLAGADEEGTLARLRALRSDLIDPAVAAHHGRIVKRTGDGSIIEFRSVVDAVRCAIEMQNGMVERNAAVPPDSASNSASASIWATSLRRLTAI